MVDGPENEREVLIAKLRSDPFSEDGRVMHVPFWLGSDIRDVPYASQFDAVRVRGLGDDELLAIAQRTRPEEELLGYYVRGGREAKQDARVAGVVAAARARDVAEDVASLETALGILENLAELPPGEFPPDDPRRALVEQIGQVASQITGSSRGRIAPDRVRGPGTGDKSPGTR